MTKFILLDPSLKKTGGHYLAYANRVLDIAEQQGFETVIVAHKECIVGQNASGHKIMPWFHRDFYENSITRVQYFRNKIDDFKNRWGRLCRRFKLKVAYSSFVTGLSLAVLKTSWTERLWENVRNKIVLAQYTWRPFINHHHRFGIIWRWLGRFIIFLLSGPVWLYCLAESWLIFYRRPLFSADLDKLFNKNFFGVSDIVFIPTAGLVEVEAVEQAIIKHDLAAKLRWRILFRRDAIEGYRVLELNALDRWAALTPLRNMLRSLKKNAEGADIDFYTDTDELTFDYNIMGVYKFQTTTIPVDLELCGQNIPENPLPVLYVGDVRDEKGFEVFPFLVEKTIDLVKEKKISYVFQSNFNVPRGEKESARALEMLLDRIEDTEIRLIPGPLESCDYNRLIKSAGIMALPYHFTNYKARSSGIFAEAVAAGIPCLITAGTSMARMAEPYRQKHFQKISESDSFQRIAHAKISLQELIDGASFIITSTEVKRTPVKSTATLMSPSKDFSKWVDQFILFHELLDGNAFILSSPSVALGLDGNFQEDNESIDTTDLLRQLLNEPARIDAGSEDASRAFWLQYKMTHLHELIQGNCTIIPLPPDSPVIRKDVGLYIKLDWPACFFTALFLQFEVQYWNEEANSLDLISQSVAVSPNQPGSALLRAPGQVYKFRVRFFGSEEISAPLSTDFQVTLGWSLLPHSRGAGIGIFENKKDLEHCLRDLVCFYDYHRELMSKISQELCPMFDPACLIAQLTAKDEAPEVSPVNVVTITVPKIMVLSDQPLGYGSPQIASLAESLHQHYQAQVLLLEKDRYYCPPRRPDFLSDAVRVERVFGFSPYGAPFSPYIDVAKYSDQVLAYFETFKPDILVTCFMPPLLYLQKQAKHFPKFLILQYLEYGAGDTGDSPTFESIHGMADRIDCIIFPERNRARLESRRLKLNPDRTKIIVMHNSRLFHSPPPRLAPDKRNGRFIYSGGLWFKTNTLWMLEEQARDFGIDVFGEGHYVNEFQKSANVNFCGYLPSNDSFFNLLSNYAFSLILWSDEYEDTFYCAPNKLYDAMVCGVPFISGPHPLCLELVSKYNCGIIMDDWTKESFFKALRLAHGWYGTSEYDRLVQGCREAMDNECSWIQQFNKLAAVLPSREELNVR